MPAGSMIADNIVDGNGRALSDSTGSLSSARGDIVPPSIISPTLGDINFSGDITIDTPFLVNTNRGIKKATDWEVSLDPSFTNIIISNHNDDINLTKYAPAIQELSAMVYIRARSVADNHISDWSTALSVTTASIKIDVPTITVSGTPSTILESAVLTGSTYTVIGGADTHVSTDWTITDMSGVLVWQSLADTVNLTTITVPTGNLLVSTDYLFSIQYNSATRSSGHSVVKGTTRYTFNYIYVDMWDSNVTPLPNIRRAHSQSTLHDGKVLVTAGWDGTTYLSSCYVYDPVLNTWTTVAPLPSIRAYHSQSVLQDGKVLVTGGGDGTATLSTSYVYDPALNTWTTVAPLPNIRYAHSQSTLQDGKVLVTGGWNNAVAVSTCYVYDPALNTWTTVAPLPNILAYHSQSVLQDGKVLVTGGYTGTTYLSTSYVYDPVLNTWSTVASLPNIRHGHNQSTLHDGKVLVTGGWDGTTYLSSCYVYDQALDTWSTVATLPNIRQAHSQSVLQDGKVLVTGGWDSTTILSTCHVYY